MATGRLPDPNTAPVTAKGDLYTYSTVPAKLAVGNNGETLVADSSTSTGLRWQGQYSAGKNAVINGGMDIWQRGTSFTVTAASNFYTADRFYAYVENANMTAARSTSVPSGAGCQYSLEITGATSGTNAYIVQRIESVNIAPIKGVATISAYIYNETGAAVTPSLRIDTANSGADNYATVNINTYTLQQCANNAWTRVSYTVDLSSLTAIDNGFQMVFYGWTLNSNTKKVRITGVQIERGSVPTAFSRAQGTLAGELAACQRYFTRFTTSSGTFTYGVGGTYNTASGYVTINLPVTMRTTPTLGVTGTASNYRAYAYGNGFITCTGIALQQGGLNQAMIDFNTAGGMNTNQAVALTSDTGLNGYLEFRAEL